MSDSFHDLLDMNISFALWHELFYFHSYTNDNILEADINVFYFYVKEKRKNRCCFSPAQEGFCVWCSEIHI